jgi:hypothetical protein
MTTMTRFHSTSGVGRRAALPRARAIRDLAADWKRWSRAERVGAVALVMLVAFAMSTVVALEGH